MKTAPLWIVLAGAILVGSSLGATAARADGLPVLGVDVGATGVVTPSGQARYVTIPAGADTIVARVDAQGRPHWRFAALAGGVHDSRGCL